MAMLMKQSGYTVLKHMTCGMWDDDDDDDDDMWFAAKQELMMMMDFVSSK